jgi:hypothetical protein
MEQRLAFGVSRFVAETIMSRTPRCRAAGSAGKIQDVRFEQLASITLNLNGAKGEECARSRRQGQPPYSTPFLAAESASRNTKREMP